jgi:diadenosine tetraphosphate (Ap4A) HIT family hydrolase
VAEARVEFDVEAYERRVREGPCFICQFLAGDPDYRHETVYADEHTVAFLARNNTLRGHTLVVPRRHVEQVTGELSKEEYQRLQAVVYDVAEALKRVLPVERVYLLSLGSNQGNAHVHWHVAPLSPGVPYQRQQYHALMAEHGVLDEPPAEKAALAARLRAELAG